jgi:filamentous hemagglutinin family protein
MRANPLPRRTALRLSTALAALLASGAAGAQTLPTVSDIVSVDPAPGPPSNAVIDFGSTATSVDIGLKNTSVVINWKKFDVPASQSINFTDARNPATRGSTDMAVLNRVVGNAGVIPASTIAGTLHSDDNISVFLINPTGILFGPTAVVTVGSLVASTLDLSNTSFRSATGALDFTNTTNPTINAGNQKAVTVSSGASITTAAFPTLAAARTPGGVLLVGARVDTRGTISATGDIGIVAASDVSLTFKTGSPLSLTLNAGTPLAAPIVGRGTIGGRNVYIAAANDSSMTGALLDVQAAVTATTASASDRGIVLAAGNATTVSDRVSFGLGDLGGSASLTLGGTLTTTGIGGAVLVSSQGAIGQGTAAADVSSSSGTLVHADIGDVKVGDITAAAGNIFVDTGAGAITATDLNAFGLITASGTTIDLASATSTSDRITLTGSGSVTALGVSAVGDATISAGAITANSIGGADVTVTGSTLQGASGGRTAITATGAVDVNVTATARLGAVGSADGVTVRAGLIDATSLGATAGIVDARANVTNLTVGSVTSSGNTVLRAPIATAALTGAATVGGDLTISGLTVALGNGTAATQAADGAVSITAGSGGLTGAGNLILRSNADGTGAETLSLISGGALDFAATSRLDGGSARQSDLSISLPAGTAIALGGVRANRINGGTLSTDAAISFGGAVTLTATQTIESTADSISAAGIDVTGGTLTINAGSALSDPSDITSTGELRGQSVTLAAARAIDVADVTATTGTVSLTTSAGAITAQDVGAVTSVIANAEGALDIGSVTVSGGFATLSAANGDATLGGATTDGDLSLTATKGTAPTGIATLSGAATVGGLLSVTGDAVALGNGGAVTQAADGNVNILAGAGGLTGAANLTLRSNADATGTESLNLVTSGTIDFAATSLVAGGTARQSDVNVTLNTPGTVLTLGGVSANQINAGALVNDNAITFGGAVTLTGNQTIQANAGSISTAGIRVTGGSLFMIAGTFVGDPSDITSSGALRADTNVTLLTGRAITVTDVTSDTGTVALTAFGGNLAAGDLTAASSVSATSVFDTDVASVTSGTDALAADRSATISGVNTTVGTVDIGTSLSVTASAGGLAITGGSVGDLIDLVKAGTTGALTIGGTLEAGTASSSTGTVTVTSTTGVQVATLRSLTGNVTVTAQGGDIGGLTPTGTAVIEAPQGSLALTATGGIRLTGLDALTNIILSAGSTVDIDGPLDIDGDLTVDGAGVALGGGDKLVGGTIDIASTSAGISGTGGTLRSDADGNGAGDLVLRSATGLSLGGVALQGGAARTATVRIGTGAGGAVTTGAISAQRLVSYEPTLTATALDLDGPVTADAITTTGTLTIGATTPPATLAAGAVTSTAGAVDITAGTVTGISGVGPDSGRATIAAATTVSVSADDARLGAVTAGGATTLAANAGDLDVRSVTVTGAANPLSMSASGAIRTTSVSAPGMVQLVAGDVSGLANGPGFDRADVSGGTVTVSATASGGASALLGTVAAGTSADIRGQTLDIDSVTTSGGPLTVAGERRLANGDVSVRIGTADGGGATTISSALGTGGGLTPANGRIALGAARARSGDLTLTSLDGAVGGAGATAIADAGRVFITAGTTIAFDDVTASGNVTVTAGASSSAGRDGAVTIGTVTSTAGSVGVDAFNDAASGPAGISLASATGQTGVAIVTAGTRGDITAPAITATTGNALVQSAGAVRVDLLTATTGGVTLGGAALTGTSAAPDAAAPDPAFGRMDITAGTTIGATGGGIVQLDTVSASGSAQISGGRLDINSLTAGSTTLDTTGGAFRLGAGNAGAASIAAAGPATIGTLDTTGPASVAVDGTLDFTRIASSGGSVTIDALDIAGGDIGAGTAIDLSGRAVTLGALDAGTTLDLASTGATSLDTADSTGAMRIDAGGALGFARVTGGTDVTLDAGGGMTGAQARATGALLATAGGAIAIDDGSAGGALAYDAGTAITAPLARGGSLAMIARGGPLSLTDGASTGTATLDATGDITIGTLTAGSTLDAVATGSIGFTRLEATADALTLSGGAITGGEARAGTSLNAQSDGALDIDSGTAGGPLTYRAATSLTAGSASGGTLSLTSLGGPLSLTDGTSTGTATLDATGDITIGNGLDAGGDLSITGAGVALNSGGGGTIRSGGALGVTATSGGISGGATTLRSGAGRTLTLTARGSGGTVDFAAGSTIAGGSSASGGDVVVDTTGTARLGAVTAAGKAITLTAADLDLGGAVNGQTVTLRNGGTANSVRLGEAPSENGAEFNGVAAPRFELGQAEISRVTATDFVIDAGARSLTIGTLSVASGTGSRSIALLGTGRVDLLGRLSTEGASTDRTLTIGGGATAGTRASLIRIAATPGGGGRIGADGVALILAGDRIGAGYDVGLLDQLGLTPDSAASPTAAEIANRFVSQPNSALYNAGFAGPPYTDPVIVRAGAVTVSFRDFALFQNTAPPGQTSGVNLPGITGRPTLKIVADPTVTDNAFAFFGTVNGVSGSATSLLGAEGIEIDGPVSRGNARANGCLIGSAGGGCLLASVVQPQLLIIDNNSEIFGTTDSLALPFDPLVGSSNEALFSDIAGLDGAAEAVCTAGDARCTEGTKP